MAIASAHANRQPLPGVLGVACPQTVQWNPSERSKHTKTSHGPPTKGASSDSGGGQESLRGKLPFTGNEHKNFVSIHVFFFQYLFYF